MGREGNLDDIEEILAKVEKEYRQVAGALEKELQKCGE
jgi:hypothetical protein